MPQESISSAFASGTASDKKAALLLRVHLADGHSAIAGFQLARCGHDSQGPSLSNAVAEVQPCEQISGSATPSQSVALLSTVMYGESMQKQ